MPDLKNEALIAERLGTRGHGAKAPQVVTKVLRLAQQGYSFTQMYSDPKHNKGIPHPLTLHRWMHDDPEFAEAYKENYRDYVDNQARQMLPLASGWGVETAELRELMEQARKLPKIRGLKAAQKVAAIDKMISRILDAQSALLTAQDKRVHRTLQIAGRVLPDEWGEKTEGTSNMIVIDVGLEGPIKTINLPGSADGQNAAALGSMRNVTPGAEE
jgi:hypothetical protein